MLSKMVKHNLLKGNKKVPAGVYVLNIPLIINKGKTLYTSNPRYLKLAHTMTIVFNKHQTDMVIGVYRNIHYFISTCTTSNLLFLLSFNKFSSFFIFNHFHINIFVIHSDTILLEFSIILLDDLQLII